MKRIALFLMTNIAVMVVLGIAINVLGLNRFINENGLDLTTLLGFSLVIGFGGAFISLLMSKFIAKRSTGAQIINDSRDPTHAWIVDTVKRFASQAGLGSEAHLSLLGAGFILANVAGPFATALAVRIAHE